MENKNAESERKLHIIKNPGTVQNLSYKCTEIFPRLFDGFRVIVNRSLSQHFQATHSIFLSSITPGNYRFGATYVGSKEIRPHENVPVLLGDVDSSGKMNVIMYHVFGSRFKVEYAAQVSNRSFVSSQLTTDYFGDTWTASAILSNADLLNNSGSLVLQHLQRITPRLDLGVELCLLRNMVDLKHPRLNHNEAQVAVVGRYSTQYTTWCAHASLHNVLLSCYKRASEQLEFGIQLDANLRTNESVASLAYRINLRDRGIIFKGCIDTYTNISSVYEKRICGSRFSYAISLNLNHSTSNFSAYSLRCHSALTVVLFGSPSQRKAVGGASKLQFELKLDQPQPLFRQPAAATVFFHEIDSTNNMTPLLAGKVVSYCLNMIEHME